MKENNIREMLNILKRYKEKLEDYLQDKKYIENIDVLYYQFLETYKGV